MYFICLRAFLCFCACAVVIARINTWQNKLCNMYRFSIFATVLYFEYNTNIRDVWTEWTKLSAKKVTECYYYHYRVCHIKLKKKCTIKSGWWNLQWIHEQNTTDHHHRTSHLAYSIWLPRLFVSEHFSSGWWTVTDEKKASTEGYIMLIHIHILCVSYVNVLNHACTRAHKTFTFSRSVWYDWLRNAR